MKSSTRFKSNHKGIECLNCEQPIHNNDNFCSNCGQVNDTKPLSIKQFVTELLGGFFAFDTRTLNTLLPLLIKPGKVTTEYINGKRKKYVNPFQLYLHTSIVFFLLTGLFSSIDDFNNITSLNNDVSFEQQVDSIIDGTKKEVNINDDFFKINFNSNKSQKTRKEIVNNSKELLNSEDFVKYISDTTTSLSEKDQLINDLLNTNISKLYAKLAINNKENLDNFNTFKKSYLTNFQKEIDRKNITYKVKNDVLENTSAIVLGSTPGFEKYNLFINSKTKNVSTALDSLGYKKTSHNIIAYKKLQEIKEIFKSRENIKAYSSKLLSNLSIILFFMLPVFTLFVHLIYIRRKQNYTENLIFVFNIQTVFFILLLISIIFDRIFNTDIATGFIFIIAFLIYLYKAMRNFYKQRKIKTIIKFLFLNMVYLFLSVIGFFIIAFLAFLI